MFSPLPGTGFLQNNCFFGEQKVFCQTFFTSMATRFVNITNDDVEIFIEGEEKENTRKKNEARYIAYRVIHCKRKANKRVI